MSKNLTKEEKSEVAVERKGGAIFYVRGARKRRKVAPKHLRPRLQPLGGRGPTKYKPFRSRRKKKEMKTQDYTGVGGRAEGVEMVRLLQAKDAVGLRFKTKAREQRKPKGGASREEKTKFFHNVGCPP